MNNDKSLEVTLAGLAIAKPLQKWTVYSWGTWETQRIPEAWAAIDRVAKQTLSKVRVEGPKWMVDGTPIEQNSLQRVAYVDRPGWHGRSNFTDEQLREILQLALARPTQLALHVVGDAETDRVLKMMEQLAPVATWRANGDGIGRDVFEKAAQLGLVVIQNPTHLAIPPIAGKKVLDHEIVLKSFVNAGIPLALGSDGGVAEQNPFLNLMLAVLVPSDPSEALTREQALTAYTAGGAHAEGQDQRKGRLAPGFTADLAVLSQDVLTVSTSRLPATTSLLTMVDGEVTVEDARLTSPH
jgi:predicted amidohydrolase YtcJ